LWKICSGTQEAPLSIQPREAPEPFSEIAAAPTYEDIDDLLEEFPEDLVEVPLSSWWISHLSSVESLASNPIW